MYPYELDYPYSFLVNFGQPWLCFVFYDARQRQKLKNCLLPDATHWFIYCAVCWYLDCSHLGLHPKYWHPCFSLILNINCSITHHSIKKRRICGVFLFFNLCRLIGFLHPINHNIKTEPDHVHKVPVPRSTFKRKVVLWCEMTLRDTNQNNCQHDGTHCDVEAVETSQHEEC